MVLRKLNFIVCFIVFILVGGVSSLFGQNYPVRATVQLSGFSSQLENYYEPGRVMVTLLNTDLRNPYEGLLRISLSGQGFSIKTKETFVGAPIVLPRNQAVLLNGFQLLSYFDPINLDFAGINLEDLQQGGGFLTEGPISLCVEVVDFVRFLEPPVSNTACATGFIQLHRPPEILEPQEYAPIFTPQQLRFLWQPQHAGLSAEYTLEVYEDLLPGLSPEIVIGATQPLLVQSSFNTAYLMTNQDQLLRPGGRYYVRVQARDVAGQAVFLNEGWSNIHSFIYGSEASVEFGECQTEPAPYLVGYSGAFALLAWESQATATDLEVRYRPAVVQNWDTLQIGSPLNFNLENLGLNNQQVAQTGQLSSTTLYLAQLRERCTEQTWSLWSEPLYFHMGCSFAGNLRLDNISDQHAGISGLSMPNSSIYQFEYRLQGSDNWLQMDPASQPEIELGGLQPQSTYETRMRFWCTEGAWSNYSPLLSFTTLATCPIPQQIVERVLGEQDAQLSWQESMEGNGGQIRYRLWAANSTSWQVLSSTASAVELNQLDNGGIYEYQIRSDCGTHFSEWTIPDTFALFCGPPELIVVTELGEDFARLRGERLSATSTATIFEYQETAEQDWHMATAVGPHEANLDDLEALTYYNVRARAICIDELESSYSDTIQLQTLINCTAPMNLAVSDLTGSSARLSWRGQQGATSWELHYRRRIDSGNNGLGESQGGSGESNTNEVETVSPNNETQGSNTPPPSAGNGESMTPQIVPPNTNNESSSTQNGGTGEQSPTNSLTEEELLLIDTAWTVLTTSNTSRLLTNLFSNAAYEARVMINCSNTNTTAFSPIVQFETTADCDVPANLLVTDAFENSVKINIGSLSSNHGAFIVSIRSTNPILLIPGYSNWDHSDGFLFDTTSTYQTWGSGPILNPGPVSNPVDSTATSQTWGNGPTFPPNNGNNNTGNNPNPFASGLDTTRSIQSTIGDSIGIYVDSILTNQLEVTFNALLPDTEYEVSVRAYCADYGWTERSNWVPFQTDLCLVPEVIAEEIIDRNSARVSWRPIGDNNNYEFKYRLAETAGANWVKISTTESSVLLENLLSNAIYDYQVAEVCARPEELRSSPQDSFRLGLPSINNGLYVCGLNTNIDVSNQIPLPQLLVDDTITAFDFPVLITMANGSNGYFSGAGEIQLPYFNKANFAFTFDSVFINNDYQLVNGYLGGEGFGIEVLPPWADSLLANILDVLETLESSFSGDIVDILEDIVALGVNSNMPEDLLGDVQSLLSCMQAATNSTERDNCLQAAGNLIQELEDHFEELFDADYLVLFAENSDQQYGFDAKGSLEPADWYTVREISGSDYHLPFKSVRLGYPDLLDAIIPPGHEDSTLFSQPSGLPLATTNGPGGRTSLAFRENMGDDYYLVAKQEVPDTTDHIAGLVQVVPYEQLNLSVTLIPLSTSAAFNISPVSLEEQLSEIFQQAIIKPDLNVASVFNPVGFDGQLDAVSSGLLSAYTSEMNTIIDAYIQQFSPNENDYFVFLVDNYESTDRGGYMPRGRNFGFLYMGNAGSGAGLARTLGHELGHGAFVLEHTFDAYPGLLPQGTTTNLMDYSGGGSTSAGSHLYKWQWDLMHDPVNAPLFPNDGSGSSVTVSMDAFQSFANSDGSFTFLSPAGMPITLPSTTASVTFYTGESIGGNDVTRVCGGPGRQDFRILPFGTVKSFKVQHSNENGNSTTIEEFTSCYMCGANSFRGYVSDFGENTRNQNCQTNNVFRDTLSRALFNSNRGGQAILGFPCMNGRNIVVKVGRITLTAPSTIVQDNHANGNFLEFDGLLTHFNMAGSTYQENPSFDPPINATYGAQFLDKVSVHASCGDETALYAFAHLHQLNEHPEFFKYCGIDLVTNTEVAAARILADLNWWYELSAAGHGGSATQGGSVVPAFSEPPPSLSNQELQAWQEADMTIYDVINDLQLTIWSDEYFASINEEDSNDRIRFFDDIKKYKDYPCVFIDLSLANRLKCLRILKHLDDFLNTEWMTHAFLNQEPGVGLPGVLFQAGNNVVHEHIYNVLLKTTPPEEYSQILDYYRGENGQFEEFYEVVDQMQEWFNDAGYRDFSTIITYMILDVEGIPSYDEMTNASGTYVDIHGQENSNELHPIGGYYPGLASGFSLEIAELYSAEVNNGKVKLSGDNLSFIPFLPGPMPILLNDFYIESSNPFDFIAIHVDEGINMRNIATNWQLTVGADGILIVPYTWAAYIFETNEDAVYEFSKRVVQDIAAIIAAIPTGGTSLSVLAAAEITYNTVDILMAAEAFNFQVTGEEVFPPEVHQAWDLTGTVIGLAGAVQSTGLIKTNINGIVKHIKIGRLKGTIKMLLTDGRQAVGRILSLVGKVKETYTGLLRIGRPPEVETDEIWDRYLNNYEREIRDAELFLKKVNLGLDPNYNSLRLALIPDNTTQSYVENTFHVFFQQGSVMLAGVGTMSRDEALVFTPNHWEGYTPVTPSSSTSVVATYDNLNYIGRAGNQHRGSLSIHYDPVNDLVFVSEVDPASSFPSLVGLRAIFTSKGWDWSIVGHRFGALYDGLSEIEQGVINDLVETWQDNQTGQDKFEAFSEDLLATDFSTYFEQNFYLLEAWESLHAQSMSENALVLGLINSWYSLGLDYFTYSTSGSGIQVSDQDPIAQVIGQDISYFYTGYGGNINAPLDQTIFLIGEDDDLVYLSAPPNIIITTGIANPGGLSRFTQDVNSDWIGPLQAAAQRGDLIRLFSDPNDPQTIWSNGIPLGQTGNNGVKTRTGQAIDHLIGNMNYHFDPNTFTFVPNN